MSLEDLGKIALEIAQKNAKKRTKNNAVIVQVSIWRGEVIRIALVCPETETILQQKHFEKYELRESGE